MDKHLFFAPYIPDATLFSKVTEYDRRGKCALQHSVALLTHCGHKKDTNRVKRSAQVTAQAVGCTSRMVERIRFILDHGTDEIKDRLQGGQMSIAGAYREIQQQRRVLHRLSTTQGLERLPLPSVLFNFIKEPIPSSNFRRTWNAEETELMIRLLERLQEQGWLTKEEGLALGQPLKRRFLPIFGGAHNGTPPQDGSNDA